VSRSNAAGASEPSSLRSIRMAVEGREIAADLFACAA
jgi:hypothetical protein